MENANPQMPSIRSRLRLVNFLLLISFVVAGLVLSAAYMQVRNGVDEVVAGQLQQTVRNSQTSRNLARILARMQMFSSRFFGDDSYLESEGPALLAQQQALLQQVEEPGLRQLLGQMSKQTATYLRQCRVVNELLKWRREQDADINQTLKLLEELVSERMIEETLAGHSVGYFEQLTLLLSGYRETMLEIAKINAEEDHQALMQASFSDVPPVYNEIKGFAERLKSLTASEPPIDRFGRHLLDQVAYYQHLLVRYQQQMIHLGEQHRELERLTSASMAAMDHLDQQSAKTVERVSSRIKNSILSAGLIVLVLLALLALLQTLAHRRLFRNHIQAPMDLIRERLQSFRQGDYTSPISLNRDDEWGQIEEVFNGMLADLVKSWSALQLSEERYREIFDNASEGIFQSTLDGKSLKVNPAMAAMFGYDSPPAAQEQLTDIAEQMYQDAAERERLVQLLRSQARVQGFETRMTRRNGDVFWATINCRLVKGDAMRPGYIEGTISDITERRQATDQLRRLRHYLQDILDSMPSLIIGVDAQCRVTLWNKQAELQCGASEEEAMGRALAEVFGLFDPYLYLPSLHETLQEQKPTRLHKVVGQQKRGQGYFDVLIYPLAESSEKGAVIHVEEITERVQIEEMMVQSEKMLSVGGLAAGMAHEINNPLAAILQNAQVMERRLSTELDKNRQVAEEVGVRLELIDAYVEQRGLKQILEAITASGKRAAKIVESMLSFSRKSTSQFVPCSLEELLEQTLVLAGSDFDMKKRFDFRSLRIKREFEEIPDVPCESSQIQQVILNLLKNSAQALTGQEDGQICLRIFRREQSACLQVADNGPGMDEEVCKRIFEPFYTTREVGTGTGLGLSVAYFIVSENHNGSLTVDSEPGGGACFTVCLPLEQERRP